MAVVGGCGQPCCLISVGGCSTRDQDEAETTMAFGGAGLRQDGGVWWVLPTVTTSNLKEQK